MLGVDSRQEVKQEIISSQRASWITLAGKAFFKGNKKPLKDFEHLNDRHNWHFGENDSGCRVEGGYELEKK